MTLIRVTNHDGSQRRCDARCHNAKQPTCDCVCGGMNHGVGTKQALANTRLAASKLLGKDERTWACLAYRSDGTLCGEPAVAVDRERGIPVCAAHAQVTLPWVEAGVPA